MKAVILAGGLGSRISEESHLRPKPMIEIGGRPILWHIMKIYAAHGISEFVICAGYKSYVIKEYFANYLLHASDVTFDVARNTTEVHQKGSAESWRITIADTGEATQTGGRLKRVQRYVGNEDFCCTYGDGVGDIDIGATIAEFKRRKDALALVTAVQPQGRFGALSLDGDRVTQFVEKPPGDHDWVNGGFFVFSPGIFDYIDGDATMLEREPMRRLSEEGKLTAYRHRGFWQPMDTLRERNVLEQLWASGKAPWQIWK
jgi:glucose-1-phosphate cytidylyltransferase